MTLGLSPVTAKFKRSTQFYRSVYSCTRHCDHVKDTGLFIAVLVTVITSKIPVCL